MSGKKRAGWIGLCVVALLAAIGVQLLGSMLVVIFYSFFMTIQSMSQGGTASGAMQAIMGNMGNIMSITLVVVGILLLFVFVPWFYFGCGRPKVTLESAKTVFAPRTLLVVLLLAVGLNYGINCFLQLIYELKPELLRSYQELLESSGLGINDWANAAAVILAPLGEELIFRGVIFQYARKAVSGMQSPKKAFWIANCIQALLFGIYHLNLVQGIYAFVIGLVLGYLCQKYHSVIPGILAHLVFNGISTLLSVQLYGWIPESVAWYGLITAAGIILVLTTMLVNGSAVTENNQNIA